VTQGIVSGRRPFIGLLVRGPGGAEMEFEFLLDTGFARFITVIPGTAAVLVGGA
jgi:predicted aspartyl protease